MSTELLKTISTDLKRVLLKQDAHDKLIGKSITQIAVAQTELKNIHSLGCIAGTKNVSDVETDVKAEISKLKFATAIGGVLATALTLTVLFISKITK